MQTKLKKVAVSGVVAAGIFLTATTASAASYTVKSGDTLSKIAADYNTTVENLVVLNKITNKHFISVGQVIELDGYVSKEALTHVQDGVLDAAYAETITETVTYTTEAAAPAATYTAPATQAAPATTAKPATTAASSNIVLANGNTAGATGSYAAAKVAAATGTSASQWEYIIAKESNGNVSAYNPSGASGLFQTMPFWGSTATVEDQIQAAIKAYNAQGFSAWGV